MLTYHKFAVHIHGYVIVERPDHDDYDSEYDIIDRALDWLNEEMVGWLPYETPNNVIAECVEVGSATRDEAQDAGYTIWEGE